MNLIFVLLIVILLCGGGWGFSRGGWTGLPYGMYGGGAGIIVVILVVLMLMGRL